MRTCEPIAGHAGLALAAGRWDTRWAAALGVLMFSLLVAAYSLTYSGTFRIDDEHVLAARSQSLAFWGQLNYPQVYGNDRVRELSTLEAEAAPKHTVLEPAQTVAGSLLFLVGRALGVGGMQAALTLNTYVTALTGAVVMLGVLRLGFRPRTAVWSGLLYGIGTMAWPYAKTFLRDPLAALMVAVSFLGWVSLVSPSKKGRVVGACLLAIGTLGGALAKHTATVLLPAFALSAILIWLKGSAKREKKFRGLGFGLLGAGGVLVVLLALPSDGALARYSPSYFSWVSSRFIANFRPSAVPGLLGPFISPAKSVFLFSPVLVLAPYAAVRWWRSYAELYLPAVLSIGLLALAQALFHGSQWGGTLVWGLRYMLPAMPLLVFLGAPVVDEIVHGQSARGRMVLGALLSVSALIQIAGAVVAWHLPYRTWLDRGLDPYSLGVEWDLRFLVIPEHFRQLLTLSSWDIAWVRSLPDTPEAMVIPLIALGVIASCILLWRDALAHWQSGKPRLRAALIVGAVACVIPVYPSLLMFQGDPALGGQRPEFASALAWIEDRVGVEDLVVVDSYGTPLWRFTLNRWTEPVAWYSLPFEIPGAGDVEPSSLGTPSRAALELFGRVGSEFSRLWYISSSDAPDSGLHREISWLDSQLELAEYRVFVGKSRVEVSLYSPDDPGR